jgi:high-affinity iron transporter
MIEIILQLSNMVWHIPDTDPEIAGGGWGVFNSILGWQGTATNGSIISYCLYWIAVIIWLVVLRIRERRKMLQDMRKEMNNEMMES